MGRVLLDTDILSEILKRKHPSVVARAEMYLAAEGRFTFSVITAMEIVYGLRRVGREDSIRKFESSLADAEVLSFDQDAACLAGRINADLERGGRSVGMPDIMIAAIALERGLPVVTGNERHFAAIAAAGYPLAVENWRSSVAPTSGS